MTSNSSLAPFASRAIARLRAVMLLSSAIVVGACAPSGSDAPDEGSGVATAAPASALPGRFVDATWLIGAIDDPGLVVLTVGSDRDAWETGHIPGARFVPFGDLVVTRDGMPNELPTVDALDALFESLGVSDGSTVVIDGAPLQAARTLLALDYLGLGDRIAILEGGLEGWTAAGGTVSTEAAPVEPGVLTPSPREDLVVDADWIAARLDDPGVVLVDARPAEQYTGATPGGGVERGGHLPGAVNVFWEETTTSTSPLALRGESELRSLFEAAGVEPGDVVVAYCRTGVQASMVWAVASALGYETRIYDASYLDWSARSDLPVAR